MNALSFEGVRFAYGDDVVALDGIDLQIEQGEFVCVLGGNGSGKSTLARHANALLVPDEGTVSVFGRDTKDSESTFSIRSSVGMVFQNPDDQIVASIIEDDVAFGPGNLGVSPDELRVRVTRALELVGLQGFEAKETSTLSGGQKQQVALAGVLAMEPQILVLDEASAMLDPRGRAKLTGLCHELNKAGLTIVYITHFIDEVADADRIIVLDAGHVALDGKPIEVLTRVDELKRLYLDVPFSVQMSLALQNRRVPVSPHVKEAELELELRRLLELEVADADEPLASLKQHEFVGQASNGGLLDESIAQPQTALLGSDGETSARNAERHIGSTQGTTSVIRLENVSFTYKPASRQKQRKRLTPSHSSSQGSEGAPMGQWAIRNVSLEVERGDFLGIAGHTGSGKSTLIQLAAGILQPTSGLVLLNAVDLGCKKTARSARGEVGLVFQYPERQLFAATVFDDVAFGPRNQGLSEAEVEACVRRALELVHVNVDDVRDRSPFALSGGQQRRIAIAGVLAMEPNTLIMDEPTAGLDPQSREALLTLVSELHDAHGLTIVFVSHGMDDLARLCNRVIVLNEGEVISEGTPVEVFADEVGLKRLGLGIPRALHLANALGIPVGRHIPSVDELACEIALRYFS